MVKSRPMSETSRLLTASQAAEILKVSPKQVTRWCVDGTLPRAEKGEGVTSSWKIPNDDVAALAERRRAELLDRMPEVVRVAEGVA